MGTSGTGRVSLEEGGEGDEEIVKRIKFPIEMYEVVKTTF